MMQLDAPPLSDERRKFLSDFMERTDYGRSDILAFSTTTKIVLTRNGGKYRVTEDELERIAGPSADPTERL